MKLILASASPRRKMLLEQIGLSAEVMPSGIEEIVTKTKPDEVVMELSQEKAADVAEKYRLKLDKEGKKEDFAVIGSDTVVAADGKILGKPKDKEDACAMIAMLSGKVHQVYTGVTLILCRQGSEPVIHSFAEKTDVEVFPMSNGEIMDYVESGEPMDKAGAYGIQGRFAAFIKGICGDYSNVVGLPVGRTYQELKKIGFPDHENLCGGK